MHHAKATDISWWADCPPSVGKMKSFGRDSCGYFHYLFAVCQDEDGYLFLNDTSALVPVPNEHYCIFVQCVDGEIGLYLPQEKAHILVGVKLKEDSWVPVNCILESLPRITNSEKVKDVFSGIRVWATESYMCLLIKRRELLSKVKKLFK